VIRGRPVRLPRGSHLGREQTLPDVENDRDAEHDAAKDVIDVIRAGSGGYVTKSISPAELDLAVRRVNDGDAVPSGGSARSRRAASRVPRRQRRPGLPPRIRVLSSPTPSLIE